MKTYIATPLPIDPFKEQIEMFLNCKMEIHEQNNQVGILNMKPSEKQLDDLTNEIDIEVIIVDDLSEWV